MAANVDHELPLLLFEFELQTRAATLAGAAGTLDGRWDELSEGARRRIVQVMVRQTGLLQRLAELPMVGARLREDQGG